MSASIRHNSQDGQHLNQFLRDALTTIRESDGRQRDDQLSQGRFLIAFEGEFKTRNPNGDAFKALAVKSEQVPGVTTYTDRHLRNLCSFARLFESIKEQLDKNAKAAGCEAAPPPAVSMTHYLTVDVGGLTLDRKIGLLRHAESEPWSVKRLEEEVDLALGISGAAKDFDKAMINATKGISKLTELVTKDRILDGIAPGEGGTRWTALWDLNRLIATYGKALAPVVPEAMQDSVPTCKSTVTPIGGAKAFASPPLQAEGGAVPGPTDNASASAEAAKAA